MKKEYTKPVMDCEVFVANEYVAACYKVQCQSYSGKKEFMYMTVDPKNVEGFYYSPVAKSWCYTGTIAGQDPEWHSSAKVYAHYVVISKDLSTAQHPNASV